LLRLNPFRSVGGGKGDKRGRGTKETKEKQERGVQEAYTCAKGYHLSQFIKRTARVCHRSGGKEEKKGKGKGGGGEE